MSRRTIVRIVLKRRGVDEVAYYHFRDALAAVVAGHFVVEDRRARRRAPRRPGRKPLAGSTR